MRYSPEGMAEFDGQEDRDQKRMALVLEEVREKCTPQTLAEELKSAELPEFPNEPFLCPGRRLLDDSKDSFKHYDRLLSVLGIPAAPV